MLSVPTTSLISSCAFPLVAVGVCSLLAFNKYRNGNLGSVVINQTDERTAFFSKGAERAVLRQDAVSILKMTGLFAFAGALQYVPYASISEYAISYQAAMMLAISIPFLYSIGLGGYTCNRISGERGFH